MTVETIKIPDIGGATDVEVIEVCVAAGDVIKAEQSLIVLESDKASMEVPSPIVLRIEQSPETGKYTRVCPQCGKMDSAGRSSVRSCGRMRW